MTAIQHEIKTACKIIVNSCILLDENSIGKFVKGDGAYLGMTKKDWFPFLPAYYINPARFKDEKYNILKKYLKKNFNSNQELFKFYGVTISINKAYYCYNNRQIYIVDGKSFSYLNFE